MTIIVDECLPKRTIHFFAKDEVWTVPQIGLSGFKDAELLDELDNRNIDVFITIDGNIEFQQQFQHRKFGTIVIRSVSNRFADLQHLEKKLQDSVASILPSQIVHLHQ